MLGSGSRQRRLRRAKWVVLSGATAILVLAVAVGTVFGGAFDPLSWLRDLPAGLASLVHGRSLALNGSGEAEALVRLQSAMAEIRPASVHDLPRMQEAVRHLANHDSGGALPLLEAIFRDRAEDEALRSLALQAIYVIRPNRGRRLAGKVQEPGPLGQAAEAIRAGDSVLEDARRALKKASPE